MVSTSKELPDNSEKRTQELKGKREATVEMVTQECRVYLKVLRVVSEESQAVGLWATELTAQKAGKFMEACL